MSRRAGAPAWWPAARQRKRSIARSAARANQRQARRRRRRGAAWLPQETILFDRARLSRRIEVDLAESARCCWRKPVVFGRTAMGEAIASALLSDRWRLRREGRLIYAEARGSMAPSPTKLGEARRGQRRHCDRHRADRAGRGTATRRRARARRTFGGEVGISAWNGDRGGAALRQGRRRLASRFDRGAGGARRHRAAAVAQVRQKR